MVLVVLVVLVVRGESTVVVGAGHGPTTSYLVNMVGAEDRTKQDKTSWVEKLE